MKLSGFDIFETGYFRYTYAMSYSGQAVERLNSCYIKKYKCHDNEQHHEDDCYNQQNEEARFYTAFFN